jgi:hypothetical protein
LPQIENSSGDLVERWQAQLQSAAAATYVLVTHPGCDADDMRQMFLAGMQPGQVARERDAEREALCDPRFATACRDNDVHLVRYTDVTAAQQ